MSSKLTLTLHRYWPVLVATAVLLPHALMFDFVNDDAYISFRYAENLARHGELVFNIGERGEGFTNFLWTVLLAGGIKLGISPVVSSRFLGVGFAIATLAVTVRMSLRLDAERPSPAHLLAPLGLACTGAFACWSTGGLETQMFTFLALLGFERLLAEMNSGRGFASGAIFALAAMTRPEGIFLFGLTIGFRLLRNLITEKRIRPHPQDIASVLAFVALFFPYFVGRWRYFGWPFPNTFYVKSSGGQGTYTLGLYYLRRFVEDHNVGLLALLGLAGWPAVIDRRRRDLFWLAALVLSAFSLYVIKVGGDFMGMFRFVLPVMPLAAVLMQESLRRLYRRLLPLVPRPALYLALTAFGFAFIAGRFKVSQAGVLIGSEQGIDSPGYLKHYVEERIPVGVWMGQHARPGDLASVGGAGVIPYYSGLRSFDCYGLVDETIAHDPKMTVQSRPGHQKWISEQYLLKRRPTLITHVYCLHERCTLNEAYWRSRGYEWVTATIPDLPAPPFYSFLKRTDVAFGPFAASVATAPAGGAPDIRPAATRATAVPGVAPGRSPVSPPVVAPAGIVLPPRPGAPRGAGAGLASAPTRTVSRPLGARLLAAPTARGRVPAATRLRDKPSPATLINPR